jgi:hypothetical protein
LAYQDDRLPHGLEVRGFLGPDLQILQRHHAPVTALLDIDEHTVEIRVESTLIAGRKRAPLPPMAPMRGDSPWDHGAECSLAGSRPPPTANAYESATDRRRVQESSGSSAAHETWQGKATRGSGNS